VVTADSQSVVRANLAFSEHAAEQHGVGASVLLPQSLSSGLVDELIATITSICLDPGARDATPYVQRKPTQHVASGTEWEMLDFWAMDTTTIGGQFRAGEPPFGVSCAPAMAMVWFPPRAAPRRVV
jgi:hypothetical protein